MMQEKYMNRYCVFFIHNFGPNNPEREMAVQLMRMSCTKYFIELKSWETWGTRGQPRVGGAFLDCCQEISLASDIE